MKFFLAYVIWLFQAVSLFAGVGAEFREAVCKIDLTQPLGTQLEQDDLKKFETLVNPYVYFSECAVFPIHWKNHDPKSFGANLLQEDLLEQYGKLMLDETPKTLTLKSGGRCAYNSEKRMFDVYLGIHKRKTKIMPAAVIPLLKTVEACAETDDGILAILYTNGEMEVFELFNREIFSQLLLEQLIVLVNLYEISESRSKDVLDSRNTVLIHPDWYEIFKTIPEKVVQHMFTDSLHVSTDRRPFSFVVRVTQLEPLESQTQEPTAALGKHKKTWETTQPNPKRPVFSEPKDASSIPIFS